MLKSRLRLTQIEHQGRRKVTEKLSGGAQEIPSIPAFALSPLYARRARDIERHRELERDLSMLKMKPA